MMEKCINYYLIEKIQGMKDNTRPLIKKMLRERDQVCKICGTDINLQYDHKVPLDRQGTTDIENLQLLCSSFNVLKSGICKRCELETCEGCPFAYPELYGDRFVVFLDGQIKNKLMDESNKLCLSIDKCTSLTTKSGPLYSLAH